MFSAFSDIRIYRFGKGVRQTKGLIAARTFHDQQLVGEALTHQSGQRRMRRLSKAFWLPLWMGGIVPWITLKEYRRHTGFVSTHLAPVV